MLYIGLLPLLLLLVSCPYIKGDDSNGTKVRNENDRMKDHWLREDKLTEIISKAINSKVADALANLDIRQKGQKAYDELKTTISKLEKRIDNQEQKVDETVSMMNAVQSCSKRPANCAEIDGGKANGVNCIYPNTTFPVSVLCSNATSGGWTVIQRRFNGSVDFYRNWKDYARGFGNPDGEHWLGLNQIHALTKGQSMELFVILILDDFRPRFAKYSNFSVSSEKEKFKLHVGGYSGNAGDGLKYHNNAPFSTQDQDNDELSKSCSTLAHGAWWYKKCCTSNLNGRYPKTKGKQSIVSYWSSTSFQAGVKASAMMIRPSNFKP